MTPGSMSPRTGAHHQPLHRRQPHRRVDRAAADDRRRRRPVAEVQHDLIQRLQRRLQEFGRLLADVLVRRAVEAVPTDVPLLRPLLGRWRRSPPRRAGRGRTRCRTPRRAAGRAARGGRPRCRATRADCAAAPAATASRASRSTSSSTTVGRYRSGPPCTTRCPTATSPSSSRSVARPRRAASNAARSGRLVVGDLVLSDPLDDAVGQLTARIRLDTVDISPTTSRS